MSRPHAHLLVIDVQEKLVPAIHEGAAVIERCSRLIQFARRLGVPVTISEHYPQGLGATAALLREGAGSETPILAKVAFSCLRDEGLHKRLNGLKGQGRSEVVVAGMEAHVCVQQTAQDLAANGYDVFLVGDAVSSRRALSRDLAIDRLARAGCEIVDHEMVMFEWLERGDTAEAKDLIRLIK